MGSVDPFLTSLFGIACAGAGAAVGIVGTRIRGRRTRARRDVRWGVTDWEVAVDEAHARLVDEIEAHAAVAPWLSRSFHRVAEEALRQRSAQPTSGHR